MPGATGLAELLPWSWHGSPKATTPLPGGSWGGKPGSDLNTEHKRRITWRQLLWPDGLVLIRGYAPRPRRVTSRPCMPSKNGTPPPPTHTPYSRGGGGILPGRTSVSQILCEIFVRNLFGAFKDLHRYPGGYMLGCAFAHLCRATRN